MNPEELLSHADFLGALARTLIFDDARAADIVQDTWAAALEKPPTDRSNLRAWLAAVAKNFARMTARSESRRTAREKAAALPERAPSSEEIVEEEEVRRKVVEAVLSLDEPYRSAIVLRYYRDLSHEETARVMEIPLATMRTYLQKGKALLRSRLDKVYHGDRKHWVIALAPFTGLYMAASQAGAVAAASAAGKGGAAAGTGVSTLLSGVIAMSLKTKLGIFAALLVVSAAITTFTLFKPEGQEEGLTFSPIETAAAVADAAKVPQAEDAGEENPRVALAPTGDSNQDPTQAADDRVRITGRVVDARGQAVEGVLLKHTVRHSNALAESGAGGRFTYLREARTYEDDLDLVLIREGYAFRQVSCVVRPGEKELYLGDLVLKPGGQVAGRIVDVQGRPFPGGRVYYTDSSPISPLDEGRQRRMGGGVPCGEAYSGEDGSFLLRGVPVGMVRVWAHGDDMYYAFTRPVEVRPGQVTSGLELKLEALRDEDCIAGVVLDPSGNPLPRAKVKLSYRSFMGMGSRTSSADKEGRFRMSLLKVRDHQVEAWDRKGRYTSCVLKDVPAGTTNLVLQLAPMHRMQVRILTEAQIPVKGLTLYTYDAAEGRGHDHTTTSVDSFADSRTLEVPAPDRAFMVEADALGFDLAVAGPIDPRALPDPLEITLRILPGIRGMVRAEGKPAAGAKVTLHEVVPSHECYKVQDIPARSALTDEVRCETDDQGAFNLGLRQSGSFYLRVEKVGFAPAEQGPLSLNHETGKKGLEVTLTPGGALAGSVLLPMGRDPSGIIILISRHDAHLQTCRTGPEGTFRFDHLTPGPWDVRRIKKDPGAGGMDQRWEPSLTAIAFSSVCVVEEGKTTHYNLDLTEGASCFVEGSLRLGDLALQGWTARLDDPETQLFMDEEEPCRLDAEGGFVLFADKAGEYRLSLTGPTSDQNSLAFKELITLVPGKNSWALSLELEALVMGTTNDDPDSLPRFHRWQGPDSLMSYAPIRIPEGDDSITLYVPPAPGEIIRLIPEMTAQGYVEKVILAIEDNSQPVTF